MLSKYCFTIGTLDGPAFAGDTFSSVGWVIDPLYPVGVRSFDTIDRDCVSATVLLNFDSFVAAADDFVRAVI